MLFDQFFHNGQPQPDPLLPGRVTCGNLHKFIKHPGQIGLSDANPGINNSNPDLVLQNFNVYLDLPVLLGKFNGIVDKICDDLDDPFGVDKKTDITIGEGIIQFDVLLGGQFLEEFFRVLE